MICTFSLRPLYSLHVDRYLPSVCSPVLPEDSDRTSLLRKTRQEEEDDEEEEEEEEEEEKKAQ
jgi:hypothetical protein